MAKKIIVIPDSFKGTLSAIEVCRIISEEIKAKHPDAEIITIPMADGGEGTCHSFQAAMGGELIRTRALGPYGVEQDTFYWRHGNTAVIEMAAIAGYQPNGRRDTSIASTYGVGQLIAHAMNHGCNDIVLGLGGSATNDGGAGMICALGGKFLDAKGDEFIPTGSTLRKIEDFDGASIKKLLEGVSIKAMCDVTNPLYGPNGAAYVFAPQKGADANMVHMLDYNLVCYSEFIKRKLHMDISNAPGSGAAGGMGAGAIAFLGAELKPGAEIVLDVVDFDTLLEGCSLVITGEGSLDSQSLRGKVVATVASHAKAKNVPVTAVVGQNTVDVNTLHENGISNVIATIDYCKNPEHYAETASADLRAAAKEIII